MAGFAVSLIAERYPHLSASKIKLHLAYSTFVSLERKFLYFEVPKAGCTLLKTIIHTAEGLPPIKPFGADLREVRRDMFIHDRAQFAMKSLVDLNDDEQATVLTSPEFLRFAIVRNPYTRLESAWRDKVRLCAPGYESIYLTLRGKIPERFSPEDIVTLGEFVDVIAKQDLRTANLHWRLQAEHLFLRAIDFSVIGRLESLDAAMNVFLEHAGYPKHLAPSGAAMNPSFGENDFDEALADKVYALYAQDFAALGYSRDSWKGHGQTSQTISEKKFSQEIGQRNVVIAGLYEERARLRKQLALDAAPPGQDAIDAIRNSSFESLFNRFIAPAHETMPRDEIRTLFNAAQGVKAGCIVEVGSRQGAATTALALGSAAGDAVPLYAIEPAAGAAAAQRGYLMRMLVASGLFHLVRLIQMPAEYLGDRWPLPISLLSIAADGDQVTLEREVRKFLPLLGEEAVILFETGAKSGSVQARLAEEIADEWGIEEKIAFRRTLRFRRKITTRRQSKLHSYH